MFLIANEITFATEKYSFGFENDSLQGSKGIGISNYLYRLFAIISKYKKNFILLGFFLKKDVCDKYKDKSKISLDFMARKVILGLRIGMFIYYLFAQILIYMKDELFPELFAYCFLNISLYFLDYILSAIGYCIKR